MSASRAVWGKLSHTESLHIVGKADADDLIINAGGPAKTRRERTNASTLLGGEDYGYDDEGRKLFDPPWDLQVNAALIRGQV